MTKMQILLDEEKIRREKKYNAQKIYAYVDSVFLEKCKLSKDADGYYSGHGENDDLLRFGKANYLLSNKDWFLDNVKVWKFFCNDDTESPDEYVVEDVRDFYLQKLGSRK
ncbi:MAG: hypothetical protein LBB46_00850 [Coriobacteriaceae bacterium]|jgi:hypothetical protein|nr:hypothetical protein [Coriobacteriaceae bacterium]